MKTKNLKNAFTALAVIATISFTGALKAQEMTLPVISKPVILEEGIQKNLSQAQIEELLPWAKDSKSFLVDLMDNIQGLSTLDQIDRLTDGIANAVGESAPKNSELLMRYVLNRGLVLNNILTSEMSADAVGTVDVKLRVLKASIKMALKYYETDMALLTKKSITPYAVFGLDYFEFLNELNKSIFDASAQYTIQRTSLEWLQWDMYRDLKNKTYAPQIVKINNSLKQFPTKKITDAQAIANIRLMKKIAQQLPTKEDARLNSLPGNGDRSAVDIKKIQDAKARLVKGGSQARRDALLTLKDIAGEDITLELLDSYVREDDHEMMREIADVLEYRLNSTSYLMKGESLDAQKAKVKELLANARTIRSSEKRSGMAWVFSLPSYMETIETDKFLEAWFQSEEDLLVRVALSDAMARIRIVLLFSKK